MGLRSFDALKPYFIHAHTTNTAFRLYACEFAALLNVDGVSQWGEVSGPVEGNELPYYQEDPLTEEIDLAEGEEVILPLKLCSCRVLIPQVQYAHFVPERMHIFVIAHYYSLASSQLHSIHESCCVCVCVMLAVQSFLTFQTL